jgi:hypothetical protein
MKSLIMKRVALAALAMVALAPGALGDDVPFARPPLEKSLDTYLISLGDIMSAAQLRHIKLWQAIKAKNWGLVNFEATLLEDGFAAAAMLYRNIPIEFVTAAAKPLEALKDGAAAKDPVKLAKSFAELTTACNACHEAGEVGFVKIQTPTSSPFTNQNFAPERK